MDIERRGGIDRHEYLRELDVSPPYSVLETTGLLSETECVSLHCRSFLDEQSQAVTPLENFLNVVYHDGSHLWSLCEKNLNETEEFWRSTNLSVPTGDEKYYYSDELQVIKGAHQVTE